MAAALCVLSSSALAQTATDANRTAGGGAQNARVQAAHAEWRRLSQSEINCVDQSLHAQRSSLWQVIQRGIEPSNSRMAGVRAACRVQARAPGAGGHGASQALAASVESTADKAAADKAVADKLAAAKAAVDKAAAEKSAGDKVAADHAAVEKAAADKVAAEKAAAEKATADKAAADKAVAEKAAADKAAADKVAADKAAANKAAADKVAAEKAALDAAKADLERAKAELMKAQADAERPRKEADKPTADVALAYAAAEARISFFYGLVSGPILFGLGGFAFLFVQRKRSKTGVQSEPVVASGVSNQTPNEFDRLVTAVLVEQNSRATKRKLEAVAPPRQQPVDEAARH